MADRDEPLPELDALVRRIVSQVRWRRAEHFALRGVFWGAWIKRDPAGHRAIMADLVRWCAEGKLSSHVHAVYPLAETPAALKALSDRAVMGKVIVRP
jgi:NADPH:quinone reductase-like Zn-dependent oxidoreductase